MSRSASQLRVILLMRKHRAGRYSIERVFESVHAAMPTDISAEIVRLPYESRGLFGRLGNLWYTARLRADVVHVTGDVYYCALAVRRKRCVLTVHDLVSVRRLTGIRRLLVLLLWYRLPMAWSSRVTAISTSTRDELLGFVPRCAAKTVVIPDPVGREFIGTRRVSGQGGSFRVLLIGTGPNKNLQRVAEALSGLRLELRIVGALDAQQIAMLEGWRLTFSATKNLSNQGLLREYAQSDLLIFASIYEGFGLPIVEAQAIGLPVITSTLASMPEVAGGAAVLVDPYDIQSIRGAVIQMMNPDFAVQELVEAGYHNAERFSPDVVAGAYAEQYRLLMS